MKYFRVFNSTAEEVGFFPQVYDAIVDFKIYDPTSSYHLNFSKANEKTLWPIPKLSTKAKKTDLVSTSFMSLSNKLLISSKLYNIIFKTETKGVQFIKTELILKKEKKEDYWIVNPFLSNYSFLDTPNCEFVYTDSMLKKVFEQAVFNTTDGFIEAFLQNKKDAVIIGYPNYQPLMIKTIAFKEDCLIDFFSVAPILFGYVGFFVSEELKNKIEKNGCTGILFTEPNERYP